MASYLANVPNVPKCALSQVNAVIPVDGISVRLRRPKFGARVRVQAGDNPILIGLGFCTIEATVDEARQLAWDLANALEQVQRGGDA
jgi:hypothetical protein